MSSMYGPTSVSSSFASRPDADAGPSFDRPAPSMGIYNKPAAPAAADRGPKKGMQVRAGARWAGRGGGVRGREHRAASAAAGCAVRA